MSPKNGPHDPTRGTTLDVVRHLAAQSSAPGTNAYGCTVERVRRAIRRGELPAVRVSWRRYEVTREDADAWGAKPINHGGRPRES